MPFSIFRYKLELLILLTISSCGLFEKKIYQYDAELLCPNLGINSVIKNVSSEEVISAIKKFSEQENGSEITKEYTVLKFNDDRDMIFKNKVGDMLKCTARDVQWDNVKNRYILR